MFFTDDLLMAKKGNFGTIWLVSTLGPRNKRVTRKALEKVEIPATCNLIAAPPEPLALRLSGQLLVGVVHVYNQSYEHFYSDVKTMDAALRRSFVTDFGSTGGAGSGELDLPGDGRTRLDLITFGDFQPGFPSFSAVDFEFSNIDWMDPNLALNHRDRRHTTPLSTLNTLSVRNLDDDDDDQHARKRPRHSTPINTDKREYKPPRRIDEYAADDFVTMDLDLDIELPSSRSNNAGFPSDDTGGAPFPPDDGGFDIPDVPDMPDMPELIADNPNGINLPDDDEIRTPNTSPRLIKRKDSSSREASDVEDALIPKPQKKKKKRVKRTTFDNNLELGLDMGGMETAYVQAMAMGRKELFKKAAEKNAAKQAEHLLAGADTWLQYLDTEMGSFVNGFSAVGKFKWQLDKEGGGNGQQQQQQQPASDPVDPGDPFIPGPDDPIELPNQGEGALDQYGPMDILDMPNDNNFNPDMEPEMEPEVARRVTGGSDLPWIDGSDFDDLPGPANSGFTTPNAINTPRVSLMTSLERSIRRSRQSMTATRHYTNRSRSGSIMSLGAQDRLNLVPDDDIELPEDEDSRFPTGHPFAPAMLASLEDQCRSFFSYVEKTMIAAETDTLELTDITPFTATKRVAATAFYNCLTLATKRMLTLIQDECFGPITIGIPPP